MGAAILDLTCQQGATFTRSVTLALEDGTPWSLAGATVTGAVRLAATEPILAEFTCTVTNAAAGQFTFALSATDTALLYAPGASAVAVTRAVYDIEVTALDGSVLRVLNGSFNISPEVTI